MLFAVNVTAALPATPSNLGVFQAACVAVLSAYGVGHTDALAYGIILQAVEIATALAMGMPALLREGMTWKDLRLRALHATPGGAAARRAAGATPPKSRPEPVALDQESGPLWWWLPARSPPSAHAHRAVGAPLAGEDDRRYANG